MVRRENKPHTSPPAHTSTMSTTKDKQIAQLSAQVAALTALVAQTIEQQQAPATKGKAKKPTTERAGNAWSVFSGAVSKRVTAIIKEGYADDTRWESEKGAEDGCKRAGFQLRVAGVLKRTLDLDDGEGGYLEPEDEQLTEAIEHLLDHPDEQSATAEARGGMSVTELKAAGMKIAKPKSVPVPVKKPAPAPLPAPAPAPAPVPEPKPEPKTTKKSPKVAPKAAKSAVLEAAAEVAEEAEEEMEAKEEEEAEEAKAREEPTAEMLKEQGLIKFKHPKTKEWYLRTAAEPKRCFKGEPTEAWANFKAGTCAGIWNSKDIVPE